VVVAVPAFTVRFGFQAPGVSAGAALDPPSAQVLVFAPRPYVWDDGPTPDRPDRPGIRQETRQPGIIRPNYRRAA
jgi:hypothetical protein